MIRFVLAFLLAFSPLPAIPAADQPYRYDVAYLTGRFDPAKQLGFVRVSKKYTSKDGYLRKEAYAAYEAMYEAAAKDGIILPIISATRNYYAQRNIWESQWKMNAAASGPLQRTKNVLAYHAMPAASRHHWGTDIDLISVEAGHFDTPQGQKEYAWLAANAPKFGFGQPYTKKGDARKTGYEEEKWHWSYLPLAKEALRQYIEKVRYADIVGFSGAATAKELEFIDSYVLGIAPECKDTGTLTRINLAGHGENP